MLLNKVIRIALYSTLMLCAAIVVNAQVTVTRPQNSINEQIGDNKELHAGESFTLEWVFSESVSTTYDYDSNLDSAFDPGDIAFVTITHAPDTTQKLIPGNLTLDGRIASMTFTAPTRHPNRNTAVTITLNADATSPTNGGNTLTVNIGGKTEIIIQSSKRYVKHGEKVTFLVTYAHAARYTNTPASGARLIIIDQWGEQSRTFPPKNIDLKWGTNKTARTRGIFTYEQYVEITAPENVHRHFRGTIKLVIEENSVPVGVEGWVNRDLTRRNVMGNNETSLTVRYGK